MPLGVEEELLKVLDKIGKLHDPLLFHETKYVDCSLTRRWMKMDAANQAPK